MSQELRNTRVRGRVGDQTRGRARLGNLIADGQLELADAKQLAIDDGLANERGNVPALRGLSDIDIFNLDGRKRDFCDRPAKVELAGRVKDAADAMAREIREAHE